MALVATVIHSVAHNLRSYNTIVNQRVHCSCKYRADFRILQINQYKIILFVVLSQLMLLSRKMKVFNCLHFSLHTLLGICWQGKKNVSGCSSIHSLEGCSASTITISCFKVRGNFGDNQYNNDLV